MGFVGAAATDAGAAANAVGAVMIHGSAAMDEQNTGIDGTASAGVGRSPWPRVIAAVCGLWALALVALIMVSSREMSLLAGLRDIASTGWGITTLVDLYAGLFFAGAWIAACEGRVGRVLAWFAGLMVTGNLALLVYLTIRAWRAADVRGVFMPPSRPSRA